MIYRFKEGSHPPAGAEAAMVAASLDDIRARYGELTTETIADDVERDGADHPLNAWFTWDFEVGMRKLHNLEAGNVVRSIAVAELVPDQVAPVRAYVLIRDGAESRYEPISVVLARPDQRNQLIASVAKEKRALDQKFDELVALVQVA